MKTSNFSKFADYIIDSVRPVQQNSRHLLDIINEIDNFYLFVLLAGHKVDFIAPCGANKSTL